MRRRRSSTASAGNSTRNGRMLVAASTLMPTSVVSSPSRREYLDGQLGLSGSAVAPVETRVAAPWVLAARRLGRFPRGDPFLETRDLVLRPGAVARHRAVAQPRQDRVAPPGDVVVRPEVELG